jgi:ribose transport system substrate-binding protein
MRFARRLHVSNAFLAASLLAISFGCNRQHITTVAVVPKASADIFWQSVHAGALKAGIENGVRIVWDGPPNETDIATEMQIAETMVNRRVDALALAPSDRSAFKIVVDRAINAGIPVIIYDSALDSSNYTSFVATNNALGGKLGADRLGELLRGKGKIVVVRTLPGAASTTAREDGFRRELNEKFPGIQILDERYGMASIAQALTVAENMLTAHPDLDGFFCSNESGTEGAARALKGRNLHLKLVGFDSSPSLISDLKAGWIESLVIQDPFEMGHRAVTEAVRAIRREQIAKHISLPPKLVNLGNLNDPAIQQQIFPDLKKYLGSAD